MPTKPLTNPIFSDIVISMRSVARNILFYSEGITMDNSNDKLFGILSYLGILWLVGLLAGKTQFTKFHANQGFVLWLAGIILAVIPFLGWALEVAALVFMIMGIVNVVNGEMKELPVIGKIHILDKNN